MSKFICALTIVFALSASAPSRADDLGERVATAAAMLKATGVVEMIRANAPAIFARTRAVILAEHPELAQALDDVMPKVEAKMTARMHELADRMAHIYADRFTLLELRDIEAFLTTRADTRDVESFKKSASGSKFLSMKGEIVEAGRIAGREWGEKIGAEADQEVRNELRAKGLDI